MKLQRFFLKEQTLVPGNQIDVLDADLSNQIRKVFRMKTGDIVGLLDNSGVGYEAKIVEYGKDEISFLVTDTLLDVFIPDKEVWLYVCIPKKDKFELVVEKATEIGVSHIVPVISSRTEKQNINPVRIKRIIKEASEQSERGVKTELHESINISDIPSDNMFAMHMQGESLGDCNIMSHEIVKVCIGPEGGFDESDMVIFSSKKIPLVSIGKQTLRAETASIAISSVLLLTK